jgi:uncharacterized protein YneR
MSNETQSIRDTCNSLNWILQSSLDFVTHQFFQQKNPKECTRGTHDFLVGTRQNFIIQGSLVNTYFFKSINTILSCLKIKFQYKKFYWYQQNEHQVIKYKKDHDICSWKFRYRHKIVVGCLEENFSFFIVNESELWFFVCIFLYFYFSLRKVK